MEKQKNPLQTVGDFNMPLNLVADEVTRKQIRIL